MQPDPSATSKADIDEAHLRNQSEVCREERLCGNPAGSWFERESILLYVVFSLKQCSMIAPMPKKIRTQQDNRLEEKIGAVRLTAEELVAEMKRVFSDPSEVFAVSQDHEFNGIDDIESELETFSGNPSINYKGLIVQFSNESVTFSSGYKDRNEEINEYFRKFSRLLEKHNSKFDTIYKYINFYEYISWILWSFLILFIFYNFREIFTIENSDIKYMSIFTIICMIVFSHSIVKFFINKRISVTHNTKVTFFQKNKDNLIVGIIIAIVAASFGSLLTLYFN